MHENKIAGVAYRTEVIYFLDLMLYCNTVNYFSFNLRTYASNQELTDVYLICSL